MPYSISNQLFILLQDDFLKNDKVSNNYDDIVFLLRKKLEKYSITDIEFLNFSQTIEVLCILTDTDFSKYKSLLTNFKPIGEFKRTVAKDIKFVAKLPAIMAQAKKIVKEQIGLINKEYKRKFVIEYDRGTAKIIENGELYFRITSFAISNEIFFARFVIPYKCDCVDKLASEIGVIATTRIQKRAFEWIALNELKKLFDKINEYGKS